ncbi:MAG TPA: MliC family protein [Lysobacter sp.]
MNQRTRLAAGLILVATMTACSPSQPPAEPEAAQPPETTSTPVPEPVPESAPATPSPDAPPQSMVVYACDDGSSLTVTYAEYSAMVKLPSGSTALPRAESASGGGGDVYIGEEMSLHRDGTRVQLQGAGKPRTCNQTPTGG